MKAPLFVRPLTDADHEALTRGLRAADAFTLRRSQILLASARGEHVPAIARALGLDEQTVRLWLRRFNADGMDGLTDAPRSGRPPVYTAAEVGEVIAASLTKPDDLGLPFGSWTLDRLTAYLHEEKGLAIGRSRIATLLQHEGLRWRQQETWFGERPDPAFAAKRGRSSRSTRRRPTAVS
jgi:transposase